MRIAIEGCGHGSLHAIYNSVRQSCEVNGWDGVDLLIIGGDFQAVRNSYDLNTMAVPQKYRAIGDFHEYYSGARKAPYLTIFVGGNHEASSHLQELYYGGWAAPNIYYLGAANVVRLGDLRITGLSGIWKGYNYNKPHLEQLPYDENEIRSLYHVRELDVRKLLQLRTPTDIGISHDWPRGIEWQGDWKALFRIKDHFEAEARAGTLGSSAAKYVMDRLRPPYWFSAHMHCKFAAIVEHDQANMTGIASPQETSLSIPDGTSATDGKTNGVIQEHKGGFMAESSAPIKNNDEIDLDMDDDESPANKNPPTPATSSQSNAVQSSETPEISPDLRAQLPASFAKPPSPPAQEKRKTLPPPPEITNLRTDFLALDKCGPNKQFLQILDIQPLTTSNPPKPLKLTYDKEWLAILRVFSTHDPHQNIPPNLGEAVYANLIKKEEAWMEEHLVQQGKMEIPENFQITAPIYDGLPIGSVGREQPREYSNPQTKSFCEMLDIPNWFDDSEENREQRRATKGPQVEAQRGQGGNRGGGRGFGGRRGRPTSRRGAPAGGPMPMVFGSTPRRQQRLSQLTHHQNE